MHAARLASLSTDLGHISAEVLRLTSSPMSRWIYDENESSVTRNAQRITETLVAYNALLERMVGAVHLEVTSRLHLFH